MQVMVSGKQMSVGEALRTRITDSLIGSIGKYFERGGNADVVVSPDGHGMRVDCRVVLASGQFLESHGFGGDAHAAFDEALAKIETRIRRYKRRLKNHHANGRDAETLNAAAAETASFMVLRSPEHEDGDAGNWDELVDQGLVMHEPPSGVIIAETDVEVKTMTVSMAVMDLDLSGAPTIVFRNAAHGGVSVVYRRQDGNVGWIDPERTRTNDTTVQRSSASAA
jgi:ribosomal subunit interface protein